MGKVFGISNLPVTIFTTPITPMKVEPACKTISRHLRNYNRYARLARLNLGNYSSYNKAVKNRNLYR